MTMIIHINGGETDKDMENIAFEMMARAHPHETYDFAPERFIAFVQKQNSLLTKEDIEAILKETSEPPPPGRSQP